MLLYDRPQLKGCGRLTAQGGNASLRCGSHDLF